jgi:hypothetical protein
MSRGWQKGKKRDNENRKKISISLKKYFSNPDSLQKSREIWHSPSYRKSISRSMKK